MHDIKAIRDNPDLYEKAWSAKGRSGAAAQAIELDVKVRAAQTELQSAQSRRNDLSKQIGQAKGRKDEARAGRGDGGRPAAGAAHSASPYRAPAREGDVVRSRERRASVPAAP